MSEQPHVEFKNSQESFGMAGPWLGDLYINETKLKHTFLDENCVKSNDGCSLLFSKYYSHKPIKTLGLLSFTPNIRDFRILIYNFKEDKFYEQKNGQDALIVKSFDGETINYYNAFHDKMEEFARSILFNETTFELKTKDEIID